MQNKIIFSTLLCLSMLQANDVANDWSISSDIRMGYVNYTHPSPDTEGIYTVPKVSILTPTLNGFSAKTTFAAVTDFGINNNAYERGNLVLDATENKSFAILQELYFSYSDDIHFLTIGRQELVTPLLEADDYYFLANSYEAINYINTSIDNLDIHLGYVHKMSGVWDSGANGTEFHSISDASFVDSRDKQNANDSGVFYGGLEYSKDAHSFKVWEYYLSDLYNMALAQYDFSNTLNSFTYGIGLQVVDYNEVGKLASNNFTQIDYTIYSAKFDGRFSNGLSLTTAVTKYSDGEGQGATLGAYGGFPSYTYGFIYSYWSAGSLQNANLYKLQLGYDLEKIGLENTSITYRHTCYGLDSRYSFANGIAQNKMRLNGVSLNYKVDDGAYFKAIYEHRKLDAVDNASGIRLIGGYKF